MAKKPQKKTEFKPKPVAVLKVQAPAGFDVWEKPSGTQITLNQAKATMKHAIDLGWKKVS